MLKYAIGIYHDGNRYYCPFPNLYLPSNAKFFDKAWVKIERHFDGFHNLDSFYITNQQRTVNRIVEIEDTDVLLYRSEVEPFPFPFKRFKIDYETMTSSENFNAFMVHVELCKKAGATL